MGHLVGKDIYKQLGNKIDGLSMRAPMNDSLYKILKELYSPLEAEVIVKMPYCSKTCKQMAALVTNLLLLGRLPRPAGSQ